MWMMKFPERYEEIKKAWLRLGFSLDEQALGEKKAAVFRGQLSYREHTFDFSVEYGPGTPYTAPHIRSLSTNGEAHQMAHGQILCWHEDWKDYGFIDPDTIYKQLSKWLRGIHEGFLPGEEAEEAMPMQYELASSRSAVLMVNGEMIDSWDDDYGFFSVNVHFSEEALQAELIRITSSEHKLKLQDGVLPKNRYSGLCVKVDRVPPFFEEVSDLVNWIETETGMSNLEDKCRVLGKDQMELGPLLGIRYPRGGRHHFLMVTLEHVQTNKEVTAMVHYPPIVFASHFLSKDDMLSRVSHMNPIQQKKAVIIGMGAVGSLIAVDLAKAGIGHLKLVDGARIKSGNVIRHAAGISYLGWKKTSAVAKVCSQHNPYVTIEEQHGYWGHIAEEKVDELLEEANLVICAVGHSPTERYVDDVTRRAGVPTLYAYASLGAVSGRIFLAGEPGGSCYHCHQYAISDQSVPPLVQPEKEVRLYEEGCAGPSFLGSGLDIGSIASQASRLALQTLLQDSPEAYEPAGYNHAVWVNQAGAGYPTASYHTVEKRITCAFCDFPASVTKTFEDVTEEGEALVNAATDWESAVHLNEPPEHIAEMANQLEAVKRRYIGKRYSQQSGATVEIVEIKDVRLAEVGEEKMKTWLVTYQNGEGKMAEEEIDRFFGHDLIDGRMQARYRPLETSSAKSADDSLERSS